MLNNVALIVAGGSGTRFDSDTPKQYHLLSNGLTVLDNTIHAFLSHEMVDAVCVVIGRHHVFENSKVMMVYGGETRQESVRNGLLFLKKFAPKNILIHDAARPFVSQNLISSVISGLHSHEAIDIALPICDTLKTYYGEVLNRDTIYATQTPQGFHFDVILNLHLQTKKQSYTDDISMYLAVCGKNIGFVRGCPKNIKITYKNDILTSEI